MNENKPKKSLRRQYIEEGIIGAHYTLNGWFVKIKPILDATGENAFMRDKPSVLFSFVKKGDAKENHFNVYVDIDTFDLWVDDILSATRVFYKTIMAEKECGEKYPKTYKYVTGNNAEKSVGFAPSTVQGAFVIINGKCGNKYANVPVSYEQLKIDAKWFRRVSESWFASAANETLQYARTQRLNLEEEDEFKEPSMKEPDMEENKASLETKQSSSQLQVPQQATNPSSKNTLNTNPPTKEDTSNKQTANQQQTTSEVLVATSSLLTPFGKKGLMCFKGINKHNKELIFVIDSQSTLNWADWADFKNKAGAETNIKVKISYTTVKDRLLVENLSLSA